MHLQVEVAFFPGILLIQDLAQVAVMAIPVAILSFGMATDGYLARTLDECYPEWRDRSFDLREILRDPLHEDRVAYTQSGRDSKTVVAVCGQPAWPKAACDILDTIVETGSDKACLLLR